MQAPRLQMGASSPIIQGVAAGGPLDREFPEFRRPSEMALMKDFWLCGAAVPVLDLDTQLMLSGERRSSTEASLLMLLGIPDQVPQGQRISCAWSQLSAIRLFWSSRSSDMQEDGASAWVANCLYHKARESAAHGPN